ncbi:MAG: ATP-dependent helicase [Candidatus Gracilibacteria bacterium]|nr:ATP-dependent helicase [Candidatus Gracilibacteria bacterium]
MVVGDDDQSIYRFQGANIENMLDFSTKYPKTEFIVLENNYRSTQGILDLSSQLINHNNERLSKKISHIEKKLISSGKAKSLQNIPTLFKAQSDIEEKKYILDAVNGLLEKGNSPSEIAIIVRGNREVKDFTQFLLQNNIEAESKLKTNIFHSQYINFILKYFKLIENPYSDENSLIDIMRSDVSDIHSIDIIQINKALYIENYSKKIKVTMIDFLLDEERIEKLALRNTKAVIDFRDTLFNFSKNLGTISFIEFFNSFIEESGLLQYIEVNGSFDDIEDIYTLFNKIKSWCSVDKNFTITKMLSKINLFQEYNYPIARQILRKNKEGVKVLTAHGSKGLEFDTVFIPGLYTGNWEGKRVIDRLKLPSGFAGDGLQDDNFEQIEEDRRLFFVAITRARENLHLSFPGGIGTKPLLQSSFLEEILGKINEITTPEQSGSLTEVIKNEMTGNMISYSDLEFDYIIEFLDTYKLSPSDLNVFLEDPLQFLQRVVYKYPFIDNKFTIFGKVYHRTLELFYLKYKEDNLIPSKDYILKTFQYLIDQEILSPEEYTELLTKGTEGLDGYYDLYKDSAKEPIFLEYSLRRKNIIWNNIPLTGTIDKIEKTGIIPDNNQGDSNEIGGQKSLFKEVVSLIDYKTGSTKSLGQIKGTDRYGNFKNDPSEGKYFRQLMFYKLLCENDEDFKDQFIIGDLALDFVEGKKGNYKYVSVEVSEDDFIMFTDTLSGAWNQINDINFWKDLLGRNNKN